jgi:hypothetical protein
MGSTPTGQHGRIHALHSWMSARRIIEIMADQTRRSRADLWPAPRKRTPARRFKACEYITHRSRSAARWRLSRRFTIELTPRGGLRLLQRDRRQLADRHHAVQHSAVRLAHRRAHGASVWRRSAREIVAIKDSSGDLPHMMRMIARRAAAAAPSSQLPHRLGRRADADAAGRL